MLHAHLMSTYTTLTLRGFYPKACLTLAANLYARFLSFQIRDLGCQSSIASRCRVLRLDLCRVPLKPASHADARNGFVSHATFTLDAFITLALHSALHAQSHALVSRSFWRAGLALSQRR